MMPVSSGTGLPHAGQKPLSRPIQRASGLTHMTSKPIETANLIERMFCRLKDFRRIATRYDKRADNFLSAVLIVATLIWWTSIESGA